MTQEELLALKAVCYGCNTNKKIGQPGATYTVFDKDMKVKEEIEFSRALQLMYEFIDEEEIKSNE